MISTSRKVINNILGRIRKQRVLYVGVSEQSIDILKELEIQNTEVWTMDKNKDKLFWGSASRHISDDIINIGDYFKKSYFDTIVLIGVLGYGTPEAKLLPLIKSLKHYLRRGGSNYFFYK